MQCAKICNNKIQWYCTRNLHKAQLHCNRLESWAWSFPMYNLCKCAEGMLVRIDIFARINAFVQYCKCAKAIKDNLTEKYWISYISYVQFVQMCRKKCSSKWIFSWINAQVQYCKCAKAMTGDLAENLSNWHEKYHFFIYIQCNIKWQNAEIRGKTSFAA